MMQKKKILEVELEMKEPSSFRDLNFMHAEHNLVWVNRIS